MSTTTLRSSRSGEAFKTRFAGELVELMRCVADVPSTVEPSSVYQPARRSTRPILKKICASLMLPGSHVAGLEHLQELARRAERGEPGMVLSWHGSNLDVPNLYALLSQVGEESLFDKLLFVAGRKLSEENPACKALSAGFSRVMISPPSYFERFQDDPAKIAQARSVNFTALRCLREKLSQGRLLFLFPTGTRYRPDEPETAQGLPQVDGYLRMARWAVFLNISGNTLPPLRGPMIDEHIRLDRVCVRFSEPVNVAEFRREARDSGEGPARQRVSEAVMARIRSL